VVLCSILLIVHSGSGVDSAEADQVGRQGIRFCAYVVSSLPEGVRYYRTTRGALSFFCGLFVWSLLLQAAAACAEPVSWEICPTPTPSTWLPPQTTPPRLVLLAPARPSPVGPLNQRTQPPTVPPHHPPPFSMRRISHHPVTPQGS
jgi:hypothetical protein